MTINSFSQNLNWRSMTSEQRHLFNINFGFDYGTTVGIGYGYKFNTKLPIVLNTEFSVPFGEKIVDDLKSKIGGQIEILNINEFSTTLKAYGVFRRYENKFTRLFNIGSEFAIVSGYYKPKWYVAGELSFDKAITTHVKPSDLTRTYFPEAIDGWFIPSGGNFSYGIQTGYSFGTNEINLKGGKVIEEDFKSDSFVPFYLSLGYTKRI